MERLLISLLQLSVIGIAKASRELSNCSKFRAPINGAVTAGCDMTHAIANAEGKGIIHR